MSNGRSPAFRFYPTDFFSDARVMAMEDDEVGVYLRLLGTAWTEGSIPADPAEIRTLLARTKRRDFDRIWKKVSVCFTPSPERPDRLIQKRLERERQKQIENRERRSEAGRKGADGRWGPGTKPMRPHRGGNANALPSDSLPFPLSLSSAETSLARAREDFTGPEAPALPNAETYSPAVQFAAWFVRFGVRRGAVPAHEGLDPLRYALRYQEPCEQLLATHDVGELVAQADRLFARALIQGPDRQRVVNPFILRDYWSRFDPPRRPALKVVSGGGDDNLDAFLVQTGSTA